MNTHGSLDHDGLDGILTMPQKSSFVLKFLLGLLFLVLLLAVFWFNQDKLLAEFDTFKQQPLTVVEQQSPVVIESVETDLTRIEDYSTDLTATSAGIAETQDSFDSEAKEVVQPLTEQSAEMIISEIAPEIPNEVQTSEQLEADQTKILADLQTPLTVASIDDNENTIAQSLTAKPISEALTPIVKRSYLFDHETSELKSFSTAEKTALKQWVSSCTGTVTIVGHTCNLGDEKYNEYLGMQRAKSMQQFLIQQNVSPELLTVHSEGIKQPVASNETWTGRRMNRRVELYCDLSS